MPDINGWEMCEKIRAFSKIPILVLSAINDPAMVAKVLDAGADDFIVKPVPSAVLIARLNMLLRRSSGSGTLKKPDNIQMDARDCPAIFVMHLQRDPLMGSVFFAL